MPKSHPCHSIPMLPWEELDITGGQSPCATRTDPVPASPVLPPASPTKVAFSSRGEEPSAASAAAPRQEPAPRGRGRAAPRDAKGQGQKEPWAQERHRARHWLQPPAPRRAPLRLTGPWDGRTDRQTDAVSSSAVPGLPQGLIPERGWDGAMPGHQGAVVTLLAIPGHTSPSASPNHRHPNAP